MKTYIWKNLSENEKQQALKRPVAKQNANLIIQTENIITTVREKGDAALFAFTQKFDNASLSQLQVSTTEFAQAFETITPAQRTAIEFAKNQIEKNHLAQLPKSQIVETCAGVFCERQARPIEKVGLYIPGGSAPLISTVLMLAIPASLAACPVKILCTPPNAKGEIAAPLLVAAALCGIQQVYKVGGAQAIAAMAYGTESIPKVDKIFGPGNTWVTQAKQLVSQDSAGASIDMPAGPSEVMVIADENANPEYVAADLLSQAEHGIDSQVILIALSQAFATQTMQAIKTQIQNLPRQKIAAQALQQSAMIIAENMAQAIAISNGYAPEHLILQVNAPEKYIAQIQNAGAVFLGAYAPETVGDYVSGANHVLPTYGYARSHSGLSVLDFMKFISFQKVTAEGLEKMAPFAQQLAQMEGLQAHSEAVSIRLTKKVIYCE